MKLIKINSPQEFLKALEKENRAREMAIKKRAEKQYEKRMMVDANNAFSKIQTDLEKLGWIYLEKFGNYVEVNEYQSFTVSPALKFVTERFNITLIPHDKGIEISKLEVTEKYRGKGFASQILDSLLRFFIKNKIEEIYILPLPSGTTYLKNSIANNRIAIQEFYKKHGFQKHRNSNYWKLTSKDNIDIDRLDLEILTNPTGSNENESAE